MEPSNPLSLSTEEILALPPRGQQRAADYLLRWEYYDSALPLLEALAAGQRDGILYRAWLGECLIGMGRLEEAESVLEPLCAEHPESVAAAGARVELLLAQGSKQRAFDACQELFRPPNGEAAAAWQKLAAYHLAAGEPAQARACCDRSEALRRERAGRSELPGPSFLRVLAKVQAACGGDVAAAETMQEHDRRRAAEAASLREELSRAAAGGLSGEPADASEWASGVSGDGLAPAAPAVHSLMAPARAPSSAGRQSPSPSSAAGRQKPAPREAPSAHRAIAPAAAGQGRMPRGAQAARAPAPALPAPVRDPSDPDPGLPADDLLPDLQRVFGYGEFRPGQRETIGRVMAGQDVLALMPTGGGKSLCYQLPALRLPHAVVVISPLIALMRDQHENVPEELAPLTTVINSSVEGMEVERRLRDVAAGRIRLIYVAPERLRQWPFAHALRQAGVSLFVIDEAHCISLWGHDFRPDYFFIGPTLRYLGSPPVLALTATATPEVQDEIGQRLGKEMQRVCVGVDRPNLHLEVLRCSAEREKQAALLQALRQEPGSAIVYARARAKCEELAELLRGARIRAIHYHAGMAADERDAAQSRFMSGDAQVVCATVAFGMGINKADIRAIVHYNLPKAVENYWQEAGRAGRDGLPARCLLLYSAGDAGTARRFVRNEALTIGALGDLYHAARRLLGGAGPGRVILDDLAREVGQEETQIRVAMGLLERVGLIERYLDVLRSVSLRPIARGDDAFQQFVAQAHLRPGQFVPCDALDLAQRTGIHAGVLERSLLEWRDAGWLYCHVAGRDPLLQVPRPPAGAREHLESLLDNYQSRQDQRVEEMIAYAVERQCRHRFIARVFGERLSGRCSGCDVCAPGGGGRGAPRPAPMPSAAAMRAPAAPRSGAGAAVPPAARAARRPGPAAPPAGDPRLAVLQMLSARSLGRSGLAQALRGAEGAPPSSHSAPGFGALAGWSERAVRRIADMLIAEGLLADEERDGFPLLRLTDAGRRAVASGTVPGEAPPAVRALEPAGEPPDGALLERLRTWRRSVADAAELPAYCVFPDRTLNAIAAARPADLEELSWVPGIGPRKLERYGEEVLRLLQEA